MSPTKKIVILGLLVASLTHGLSCRIKPQLDGKWSGEAWGNVTFRGYSGTYSSTYGTGPGKIKIINREDGTLFGQWGESDARHGSLQISFEDGDTLIGTWRPDADCTIGGKEGGSIRWTRKE